MFKYPNFIKLVVLDDVNYPTLTKMKVKQYQIIPKNTIIFSFPLLIYIFTLYKYYLHNIQFHYIEHRDFSPFFVVRKIIHQIVCHLELFLRTCSQYVHFRRFV